MRPPLYSSLHFHHHINPIPPLIETREGSMPTSTAPHLQPQYVHTWLPSLRVSLPLPPQTLLARIFDGREAYKSENSPNTSSTPLPLDSQASRFFDFPITHINHTLHRSVLNDLWCQKDKKSILYPAMHSLLFSKRCLKRDRVREEEGPSTRDIEGVWANCARSAFSAMKRIWASVCFEPTVLVFRPIRAVRIAALVSTETGGVSSIANSTTRRIRPAELPTRMASI